MKNIILDFSNCKFYDEFHKILKETFNFPEYYGENLDALWDCLDGYCDYDLKVSVKGLSDLSEEFDNYIQKMLEIFKDVTNENSNIIFEVIS